MGVMANKEYEEYYERVDEKIRNSVLDIIERKGITQKELSESLGLSKTMANKMLKRKLHLKACHIQKLCEVLECTPEELLCIGNS